MTFVCFCMKNPFLHKHQEEKKKREIRTTSLSSLQELHQDRRYWLTTEHVGPLPVPDMDSLAWKYHLTSLLKQGPQVSKKTGGPWFGSGLQAWPSKTMHPQHEDFTAFTYSSTQLSFYTADTQEQQKNLLVNSAFQFLPSSNINYTPIQNQQTWDQKKYKRPKFFQIA